MSKTDRADREQVVYDLKRLKNSRGWKFIKEKIQDNIESIKEEILDPPEDTKEELLNEMRYKLKLQQNFLKLPDVFIEELSEEAIENNDDSDNYD